MGTALNRVSLLLSTPTCKRFSIGLKRMVYGDSTSIAENLKAKAYILGELGKIAKEKKLKGFEVIRGVHLDAEPFDMERDLLTATYKKKRPQLLKYYQTVIDNMYKNASKPSA